MNPAARPCANSSPRSPAAFARGAASRDAEIQAHPRQEKGSSPARRGGWLRARDRRPDGAFHLDILGRAAAGRIGAAARGLAAILAVRFRFGRIVGRLCHEMPRHCGTASPTFPIVGPQARKENRDDQSAHDVAHASRRAVSPFLATWLPATIARGTPKFSGGRATAEASRSAAVAPALSLPRRDSSRRVSEQRGARFQQTSPQPTVACLAVASPR